MMQTASRLSFPMLASAFFTAAAISMTAAVPTTEAAIQCQGTAQVIPGGGLHVTPYCEDHNLAVVAQQAGSRVTFQQIRTNPNLKEELCHLLAGDIRVGSACAGLEGIDGSTRSR